MTTLVLAARFLLAGVFLVSGFAKLADRAGTQAAVAGFGVPRRLRPFVASALAPVELVVAAGLLATGPIVALAAAAAGGLLVAFTVAVVTSLAHDRAVACHCFGTVSDRPVTWLTVVRNLALLAVDAVVLAGGLHQPWPWQGMADAASGLTAHERWLWAVLLAAVAAVAVLAALNWSLLRRYGEVLNRLDALADDVATLRGSAHAHDHAHDHGPRFEPYPLPDDLAELVPGPGLTLLVSVSTHCAACGELAGDLRDWRDDASGPPLVVVSSGSDAEISATFGDLVVRTLPGDDAASTLGLAYTPGAVVVEHGHVVSPPSYGVEEIRALHAGLLGGAPEPGPGPGTALPDVTVLTGAGEVSASDAVAHAADLGGSERSAGEAELLVLFWDTTCGFCQQVADEVAALSQAVPTLVVLRDRGLPALRAAGVDGPVALDPAFGLGSALGAPGTPSAVLVRGGVLASTLAVGGPEVVALLTRSAPRPDPAPGKVDHGQVAVLPTSNPAIRP